MYSMHEHVEGTQCAHCGKHSFMRVLYGGQDRRVHALPAGWWIIRGVGLVCSKVCAGAVAQDGRASR